MGANMDTVASAPKFISISANSTGLVVAVDSNGFVFSTHRAGSRSWNGDRDDTYWVAWEALPPHPHAVLSEATALIPLSPAKPPSQTAGR